MKKLMLLGVISLGVFLVGCSNAEAVYFDEGINDFTYRSGTPSTKSEGEPSVGKDMDTYLLEGQTTDNSNEEYNPIVENVFINSNSYSVSTFGVDVDTASYTIIRRYLTENNLPPVDAIRVEEMVNYFSYDLNLPEEDEVIGVTTEISESPWNPDHDLLMVGLKTDEIIYEETEGSNLVFLLDVSGSMNNANKLPLLKEAIKLLVDELRPEDRISIVVYAGSAGLVLDGATGDEKEEIIAAIDDLRAGGSTAGGAGINLAYSIAEDYFIEGGNNRVILGTDGDFNVGVSSQAGLEELIKEKRETGVFLSVLGFGSGNTKDNRMETLADKGNGVYYYIDSILEAKKVFVEELGGSLFTVAKDVKLQIEFNPATVKGYRLIGYENRLLSYHDFNNDLIDSGDMGAGHEVVAFYEIIPASSDEVVDEDEFEVVEDLKYDGENFTNQIMTLSIRYKEPDEDTSKLMEHVVFVADRTDSPSETFRFASSVVEFSLLLRDSEYKYNASFQSVLDRATNAKGTDEFEYKAEFIELVQKALNLSDID